MITITAFSWVPDFAKGLVRDLRPLRRDSNGVGDDVIVAPRFDRRPGLGFGEPPLISRFCAVPASGFQA